MPRKHRVPALQKLALRSIASYVVTFGKNLINSESEILQMDREMGMARLAPSLQSMKHHLSTNVPPDLYDRMAMETRDAIINLINELKAPHYCLNAKKRQADIGVAMSLERVVLNANLRSIEFQSWPGTMGIELFLNLHCMTGLEVLNLGLLDSSNPKINVEEIIINGVPMMPNLVSFTLHGCTDNIIVVVGQNCPRLRYVNVMGSRSVTDRSVVALLKSRGLQKIKLLRTSVTIAGYANLLLGHPHLEDIGWCDDIGNVLDHIREETNNSDNCYHLRSIKSNTTAMMNHLYLLTNSCPYITRLSLRCDKRTTDLTVLAALKNLKELMLLSCCFYANHLKTLLELTNCRITNLHLEEVDELDQSALIYIGQSCPDLRSLIVMSSVKWLDHTTMNSCKSPVKPFAQLEKIKWIANFGSGDLEYLLSHCVNVKFIQLEYSPFNNKIDDAMMEKIFTLNPMTKLEEFEILSIFGSPALSMSTVQLLMQNCKNLRKLFNLEDWHEISQMELQCFREQLRVNNIDLKTSR